MGCPCPKSKKNNYNQSLINIPQYENNSSSGEINLQFNQPSQNSLQSEQYYYTNFSQEKIGQFNELKQKVQINLSIKDGVPYEQYSVTMSYSLNNGKDFNIVGSTNQEASDSSGQVNFNFSFVVEYYFEKQQPMKFDIRKGGSLFSINSNLGKIMGSRNCCLNLPYIQNSQESLFIQATNLKENSLSAELIISANLTNMRNKSLFYVLKRSKKIANNENNDQVPNFNLDYMNVYKSDLINLSMGPSFFKKIKLPTSILCSGDLDKEILFEFHSPSDRGIVGYLNTSVNKINSGEKNAIINDLNIQLECNLIKEYTFLEYIRGGVQLNMSIGIDFTGSNGHYLDKSSLHYLSPGRFNEYQAAIRSCGDIVAYYDYDQSFPVYGFGATFPDSNQVSHCFNLTLSDESCITGIDAVLECYINALPRIAFSGPTFFAPIIRQIISNIKSETKSNIYNLFLILTDGSINDINETVDALVEASFLPLSVIIVGVGNYDFDSMEALDADVNPLIDSNGKRAVRDLVQFVPFAKLSRDPIKLAEQTLAEVPKQLVEYYRLIKQAPADPIF